MIQRDGRKVKIKIHKHPTDTNFKKQSLSRERMKKSLIYISLTFAVTRNEKSRRNISLGEVRRLGLVCGTLFKLIKYSDYSFQR